MLKVMTDFKKYLQYLPPENQICEIDSMLSDFNKSIPKGENVNKTFCIVNELKTLESE